MFYIEQIFFGDRLLKDIGWLMYNEVCFIEESGEPNYFLILRDAGAETVQQPFY